MYIVVTIERRIADPSPIHPVGYLLGIIRGPSGVRGGFGLVRSRLSLRSSLPPWSAGALGVSAADTNSTLPVTLLNGRWCRQPTTALVVDDHRRRRRTTRVVLIDPHRRALLVEGRNPDDEQLTWMMVGSGIEDGENPAEAARGKCSK